jgi:hypothetical protein
MVANVGGYGGADLVEALNIIHIVCAQNGHLIPSKLRNYFEIESQNSWEMKVLLLPKISEGN